MFMFYELIFRIILFFPCKSRSFRCKKNVSCVISYFNGVGVDGKRGGEVILLPTYLELEEIDEDDDCGEGKKIFWPGAGVTKIQCV